METFHVIHLVCPCYDTNCMISTGWIIVMHRVFIACVAMHMYFGFVSLSMSLLIKSACI